MDRTQALRLTHRLFDAPDAGASLRRVDPKLLALADADHSGDLSREEVARALEADRLCLDVAGRTLTRCSAVVLSFAEPEDSGPLAAETIGAADTLTDSVAMPSAEGTPAPSASAPRPPLTAGPTIALPPMRAPEPLMMGPKAGSMPSVSVSNRGVDMTAPILPDGSLRLGAHMDTGTTESNRMGSLLIEESHPGYLAWPDLLGSGLSLGLDSRTRIDMTGHQTLISPDGQGTAATVQSAIRHEQRLHVGRGFAVFSRKQDTTLQAGYLAGFGPFQSGLPAGASQPVVSQYATINATTRPGPDLNLTGELYVPVQNGPLARGVNPIGRITVGIPRVTVGTTQSADTSRYDLSVNYKGPLQAKLSATGAIDRNHLTDQTVYSAGMQLSVPW